MYIGTLEHLFQWQSLIVNEAIEKKKINQHDIGNIWYFINDIAIATELLFNRPSIISDSDLPNSNNVISIDISRSVLIKNLLIKTLSEMTIAWTGIALYFNIHPLDMKKEIENAINCIDGTISHEWTAERSGREVLDLINLQGKKIKYMNPHLRDLHGSDTYFFYSVRHLLDLINNVRNIIICPELPLRSDVNAVIAELFCGIANLWLYTDPTNQELFQGIRKAWSNLTSDTNLRSIHNEFVNNSKRC